MIGLPEARAGEPVTLHAAVVDRWSNRTGHGPVSFVIGPEPDGGGSATGASCTPEGECSAPRTGVYRIAGYFDLPGATLSATHRVTIIPNVPAAISMAATPSTVYGSPTDRPTSTIVVAVTDLYGNATPGVQVAVDLTENQTGRPGVITPQPHPESTYLVTSSSGTGTFVYRPGVLPGRDTLTATIDALSASATVTYVPLPMPSTPPG